MRRIYESDSLHRDDDPFTPATREDTRGPRAFRSIPATTLSQLLLTDRLRDRAISVTVSTPQTAFVAGTPVPFRVAMRNALPLPVTIPTRSPVAWTWSIDGLTDASRVPLHDPPNEPGRLEFGRGERKRFTRRWNGMIRVSDSTWVPADPGEYTLAVELNVENPVDRGLAAETTVRVVPSEN